MTQPDLVGAVPAGDRLPDLHDLALALGGDITSFTGDLLRLIAGADPTNRERLRIAYPRVVRSWELWCAYAPELTAGELRQLVAGDPVTAAFESAGEAFSGLQAFNRAVGQFAATECTAGALPGETMTCGRPRPCPDHDGQAGRG